MGDISDNVSEVSSQSNHEDCRFHDDPRNGLCNALTYSKKLCTYRSKIKKPGFLAVCKKHEAWSDWIEEGRCQAIEECGQMCNRLSRHSPPYHFCNKHQKGSDTLPCHIMSLPTELRLMIFRYLFPEIIPARHTLTVKVAILKTCRQLFQEASSVLYSESRFQASIGSRSIDFRGRKWHHNPIHKNKKDEYSVEALLGSGVCLIRNLDIEIALGQRTGRPKSIGYRGISYEDYELYILRDNVRKFATLFGSTSATDSLNPIRRLTVIPTIHRDFEWEVDEATFALFSALEPLQKIHAESATLKTPVPVGWNKIPSNHKYAKQMQNRKAYTALQEQWLKYISIPTAPSSFILREPSNRVQTGFRKIQEFSHLLDRQSFDSPQTWASTLFANLERPLHLARIAYENDDGDLMDKIHGAFKISWVNGLRCQQESLRAVADSINSMFDYAAEAHEDEEDADGMPTPRELYPDAFEFEDVKPLKEQITVSQAGTWTDLVAEDFAPVIGNPDVTVRRCRSLLRIRICKKGEEWVRLKTPAIVRQLKLVKAAKEAQEAKEASQV